MINTLESLEHFKDDKLIWNQRVFPTRLNDEEVVMVVRQDVIILLFQGIKYLIVFLVILVIKILVSVFQDTSLIIALVDLAFYTVSVMMLVLFSYEFHNYYLSLQIVTTKRLIDVDQRGLFYREVNELPIEKIEDVTYTQAGILPSIFHYGTVKVLSAADNHANPNDLALAKSTGITAPDQGFVFEDVPYPAEIQAVINNLFHQAKVVERHQTAFINAQYMNQMMTNRSNNNQVNSNTQTNQPQTRNNLAQNQNVSYNKPNF